MTRTRIQWKARDHVFTLGERTLIMGVLNITPDSFSDGGKYLDPDAAVARALELEQQGADILDIGAESTKPGSERISAGEELRRLVPVLKRLKDQIGIPISVDTYKAEVAEKALEHGASIINDVSALTWEPEILKPVLQYDAGLILNHMRGTPETWGRLGPMKDVIGTVAAELEAAIHRATSGGIGRERIVIDPGIGFGKRGDQNSEILARLRELQRLGLPLLVAASRKTFLGQENPAALEFATAAAVTTAILHGAAIVRVHDVAAMKPVVQTADAVIEATPEVVVERAKPAAKPRLHSEMDAERRARPIRPSIVREKKEEPVVEPNVEAEAPPPVAAESDDAEPRPRRPFERRSEAPAAERPAFRKPFPSRDDDRPPKRPYQRQAGPPDSRPSDRGDRPFRPRPDRDDDRPARRPYQRSSGPTDSRPPRPAQGRPERGRPEPGNDRPVRRPYQRADDRPDSRPSNRGDRPFRPRPEQGNDKPVRRPYQRADDRPDSRPSNRGDRPFRPRPEQGNDTPARRPYQRADDRPERKPYEKRDRPFPSRDDARGPSKFGGRSGPSKFGGKNGPRRDKPDDRPRPGGGSSSGPKRGGGGPPRKRY